MKKSDWWSYGQTIYMMYTRNVLYDTIVKRFMPMSRDIEFPFSDLIRMIVMPSQTQDMRPTEAKIIETVTAKQDASGVRIATV